MIFVRTLPIGLFLLLLSHQSATSCCLPPSPLTPMEQVFQAEAIVVGKIVDIEDFDVEATSHPGVTQKTAYKIANVQINQSLRGVHGLTHIRVGFIPTPPMIHSQVNLFKCRERYHSDSYFIHEEGCFFLQKHHEGDFYVQIPNGNRLDSNQAKYDLELENVKKSIRVLEKPMEGLQAKESEDREFAANALLNIYKSRPRVIQGVLKEVEIAKDESKLILETLSNMENDPSNANQLSTFMGLFSLLQLTDSDGWIPPQSNDQGNNNVLIKESFDKWFKANGEKYRLKKWVVAKK
jgi:hypothetical protein